MLSGIKARHLAAAVLAVLVPGFFFLTAFYASPRGALRRYVTNDATRSVTVNFIESNNYFLINPEPVIRISFSAPAKSMGDILKAREARIHPGYAPGSGGGRRWFRPASSTNGLRQYQLKNRFKGCPEFLWIDETGTNAYYLLFGV